MFASHRGFAEADLFHEATFAPTFKLGMKSALSLKSNRFDVSGSGNDRGHVSKNVRPSCTFVDPPHPKDNAVPTTADTQLSPNRPARGDASGQPSRRRRHRRSWIVWAVGGLALAVAGLVVFTKMGKSDDQQAKAADGGPSDSSDDKSSKSKDSQNKAAVPVKVVHAHHGGITRTTSQLAEIRFFAHVQLYAKASGFLRAQMVDIGDTVRTGQVLAEVYAPELEQQVQQAAAAVEQARAEVTQAESLVTVAQADVQAQTAVVKQREAQIAQYTATRKYREKEYLRYAEMAVSRAIDGRAADEKQQDFESAKAGEEVSVAAVESARGELARAVAQVEKARADVKAANSRVLVAEAREANAQIYQQYTRLTAPFSGVVTDRNYYDGDFIRDAAQGANSPSVLALARTDLMRVIVYIPDSQVPYLDRGDEAVVRVQALGGEEFRGKISRYSNMEMVSNRAMRAEIDLPNPSGRLRHGMYGDVTILLDQATNVLTIPSPGLIENDGHGAGSVLVVRDKKARKVSVRVGKDNGLITEILSGVGDQDEVIVDYSGSLEDGSEVAAQAATVGEAKKESGTGQ